MSPSGEIYKKVKNWLRRRDAAASSQFVELPPEAEAAFRTVIEKGKEEEMQVLCQVARSYGNTVNQAVALRVTDAERHRDRAEARNDEVIDLCCRVEAERDELIVIVAELKTKLAAELQQKTWLLGSLEQCEEDNKHLVLRLNSPNLANDMGH